MLQPEKVQQGRVEVIEMDAIDGRFVTDVVGFSVGDAAFDPPSSTPFPHDQWSVGEIDGEALGLADGETLGLADGEKLGLVDGDTLGLTDGDVLGLALGLTLGLVEGLQLWLLPSPLVYQITFYQSSDHDEQTSSQLR